MTEGLRERLMGRRGELSVEAATALTEPFDEDAVKLLPLEVRTVEGWNKATMTRGRYTEPVKAKLAPYIDARDVENRLDGVLGVFGWSDAYTPLGDGGMNCRLGVRDPETGVWVHKEGVGYPGDQVAAEKGKAAESDALKRAAVKIGVGRYLYSLDSVRGVDLTRWVSLDERGWPNSSPGSPAASKTQVAEIELLAKRLGISTDDLDERAKHEASVAGYKQVPQTLATQWIERMNQRAEDQGEGDVEDQGESE